MRHHKPLVHDGYLLTLKQRPEKARAMKCPQVWQDLLDAGLQVTAGRGGGVEE